MQYDKAHSLAAEIRQSSEWQEYHRLKDEVMTDETTAALIREYKKLQVYLQVDSPYNTYMYAGLPIGPICNPSAKAIEAALYPDEIYVAENYLFFCSKDPESGELYFSKTQEEHDQAVAIYAPLWQAYDESRGIE